MVSRYKYYKTSTIGEKHIFCTHESIIIEDKFKKIFKKNIGDSFIITCPECKKKATATITYIGPYCLIYEYKFNGSATREGIIRSK